MQGEHTTDDNVEALDDTNVDQGNSEPEEGAEDFDYKASLEDAKAQKEHNRNNAQRRMESKTEKNQTLDPEVLREMIREETKNTLSQALNINKTQEFAKSITGSSEELDAVMWHLENSIKSTGDPETDIRRAHILANERKYQKATSEAVRTAAAYESRAHAAASGQRKNTPEWSKVELTPTEERFARSNGMSIEDVKKAKLGV